MPSVEHAERHSSSSTVSFFTASSIRFEIEDDDPVLLLGHHLRQRHTLLGVVAGRPGVLALVVGIDVVEIAVDPNLPGNLHGLTVDGGEQRSYFLGSLRILPSLGIGTRSSPLQKT